MCAETKKTDEIKITPSMIEAGVSAFLEYDSRFEREGDAVVSVFQAMVAAMREEGLSAIDRLNRRSTEHSQEEPPRHP
jgi:hypothetical protein